MFYARYVLAELRRRRGRTILTALGLGVGVALVVAVTALSQGLSDAQDKVLEPLTGVGTDMTVTRPLNIQGGGGGDPFAQPVGRRSARSCGARTAAPASAWRTSASPGEKFSTDNFVTQQLSFSGARSGRSPRSTASRRPPGGLTLNALHISGTVPEIDRAAGPGRTARRRRPGRGRSARATSTSRT